MSERRGNVSYGTRQAKHVSELKQQAARAFFWDFLGKFSTHGVSFFISVLLARILEPSEFGMITMVMVIIGIAGIFSDSGLGSALIQKEKVLPIHYSTVFYFNILIGLLLSTIVFFSAEWIAHFYEQDALVPLVQVLSLSFIINAFGSTQSTKLRKELRYSVLTRSSFMSSLLSGLTGLILAMQGFGVWSLVAQILTMGIFYNVFIWGMSRWRPGVEFSMSSLRELWTFGFHMFLAGLLDNVISRMDYLLIGKLFTPATLGFYHRAKSINTIVAQYSSGSLMAVLFPVLSKVQSDIPRVCAIVTNLLRVVCFTTFLLIGGLYLISEEFILLLFGEKWLEAVPFMEVLIISSFAYPLSAVMVNVLRSLGKSGEYLRLEIFKKSFVILNLGVLYLFGIQIYLFGLIIISTINLSLNILYASRELGVPFRTFASPVICQILVTVAAVGISWYVFSSSECGLLLSMLLKGFCFSTIYLVLNVLLKTESYIAFSTQISSFSKDRLNDRRNDMG
ncbi:MAG: hypothetical protein DRR42_20750 [Gammaproteobacteria bacterium]|nr:MAG: hypothetical protein DRR42_20750 [Gammaproteobacteria bacterium]